MKKWLGFRPLTIGKSSTTLDPCCCLSLWNCHPFYAGVLKAMVRIVNTLCRFYDIALEFMKAKWCSQREINQSEGNFNYLTDYVFTGFVLSYLAFNNMQHIHFLYFY